MKRTDGKIAYQFVANMWQHNAPGGWYFMSLPETASKEIRSQLHWQEEGWGRLKARAGIGIVVWETSIWFDTKHNGYILPIKASIRKELNLTIEKEIEVCVWL